MTKYGPKAQEKIAQTMHEMKAGKLRNGSNAKKLTDPHQAIAIGLDEAQREGAKPPRKAM